MKRVLVPLLVCVIILAAPPPVTNPQVDIIETTMDPRNSSLLYATSSSGGSGSDSTATMFMSRNISSQSVSILNGYTATSQHNGSIDLSSYLISGWTLFEVEMQIDNITAIIEREVVGVAATPGVNFRIYEYNTDVYYSDLTQGFYNLPHDGNLQNYSVAYSTANYVTATRGTAYLEIRSDYSTASNITNLYAISAEEGAFAWHVISGDDALLSSDTTYYTTINGTDLQEDITFNTYPTIYWGMESVTGDFETRRYSTEFSSWSGDQANIEALMNYTYIPWNQTSSSALQYQNPQEIELRANSTPLTDSNSWAFTSSSNISQIKFDSNQSVSVDHNLTLCYKKDVSVQSIWDIPDPLSNTNWNLTVAPIFPMESTILSNYVNLTKMPDWTATGLYNGSSTSNYENYTGIQNTIRCSNMTNGTWTMTFTAHNYLTGINSVDTVSILDDLSITALVKDGSSVNATDGSTNLTVWQDATKVSNPSNETVANGATQYLWDINTDTSNNGTFRIEVYWANGTEAGYLTKQVVVYYPTEFGATDYSINAYTEDSFEIRVSFNDTFTPQGLTIALGALVQFSYDGNSNQSMTDLTNGTWTATIPTTGNSTGGHSVEVYAEGFAIENQSLTISVNLLHETQPLTVSWLNGNSITYPESTILQVIYRNASASFANVTNAEVNVTIGSTTWDLTWDIATETYQIQFNGSDIDPGFAIHNLEINAWRAGYEAQIDSTQILTIAIETTNIDITWSSPHLNDITFVEQTVLIVNYTMSNGTPIEGATVNVTIDTTLWNLLWNSTSHTYYLTFNGTDSDPGFAIHTLNIKAWKYGYGGQTPPSETLTIQFEPTSVDITWSSPHLNDITFVEYTMLIVNYTMSNGTSIEGATVNVTIGSTTWDLKWSSINQTYWMQFNGTDIDPGFAIHTLNIEAWKYGYTEQTPSDALTIQREPTSLDIIWSSPHLNDITYIEYTVLCVNYTMSNGTSIEGATVNVTIGSTTWDLKWNAINQTYCLTFNGTDADPGFGIHSLNIEAWKYGYIEQTPPSETLTVQKEPTSVTVNWTSYTMEWTEGTTLRFNYSDSYGALILNAEQKLIYINGTEYTLQGGGNGTYWFVIDNTYELGFHTVVANISKIGYDFNVTSGITFDINLETTIMTLTWEPSNVTMPYTYSLNLTVEYNYDGQDVPVSATVNVTIDGVTYPLAYVSDSWYVSIPGSSIGVGMYTATTQAWLYGYEARINVTSNVNVTLAANSFIVDWIPSDLNLTYVETLQINVTYTYSFQPILLATVQLIVNSTDVYDFTYNATTEKYELAISAITLGLGTWNTTVKANKTGFDTGVEYEISTIIPDPCSATHNWDDPELLYYSHQTDLNVTLLDSLGQPIITAIVNASYQGTNYTMVHIGIGVYRLVFNGTDGENIYSVVVYSFKYGYTNETLHLNLEIENTPTSIAVATLIGSYSSSTVYYDGWIRYSYYLEDIDSNPLFMATVNITIFGNEFTMTSLGNGTHSFNLTASDFEVGTDVILITPYLTGYQLSTLPYPLEIQAIPTRLDYTTVPTIMFINDTVIIEVEFVNEHTEQRITPATIQITWSGETLIYQTLGQGYYRLNVSSFDLALISHELSMSFNLDNYTSVSAQWDITVRAVLTTFISSTTYSQYENETITLTATYYDVDHDVPIHFANVTATIGTTEYDMAHLGDGVYTVMVLIELDPNYYTVTFTASAYGCEDNSTAATLTVLVKALYTLTLEVGNPIAGTTLGVTVQVNQEENPVSGITVRVHVLIHRENDTSLHLIESGTTTAEGTTQVNFDIPVDALELEVWVEFVGSNSEWSVITDSAAFSVAPSGGILETLLSFFRTPFGIIVAGLMALVFIGIAVNAKVLSPKRKKIRFGKEQRYQRFVDLQSLKHFMAVYADRGTCVFYHPFADERIQPNLLSGFISALTSVYGEIKGDGVKGTLEVIQYKGLYLNNYSGGHIIGMLILEKEMSLEMMTKLESFVEMFEMQYDSDLTDWTGEIDCFNPDWIVSNLYGLLEYELLVPHKLLPSKKISGVQKKVVDIIRVNLDERNEFYLNYVILSITTKLKISDEDAFDILLGLRDLGYLIPISTQNILLRQGMGIFNGDDEEEESFEPEPEPIVESSIELDEEIETADSIEEVETETGKTELVSEEIEEVIEPEVEAKAVKPVIEEKIEEPQVIKEIETIEEPEKEISPEDAFLAEVESKIKKRKSKKPKKEKKVETADKFVDDIESLLSEEKDEKKGKSDKK